MEEILNIRLKVDYTIEARAWIRRNQRVLAVADGTTDENESDRFFENNQYLFAGIIEQVILDEALVFLREHELEDIVTLSIDTKWVRINSIEVGIGLGVAALCDGIEVVSKAYQIARFLNYAIEFRDRTVSKVTKKTDKIAQETFVDERFRSGSDTAPENIVKVTGLMIDLPTLSGEDNRVIPQVGSVLTSSFSALYCELHNTGDLPIENLTIALFRSIPVRDNWEISESHSINIGSIPPFGRLSILMSDFEHPLEGKLKMEDLPISMDCLMMTAQNVSKSMIYVDA